MQLILIAAQSLDGFITRHDQPGSDFTSPEDKAYFRAVLSGFDANVVGATTYRAERALFLAKRGNGRRFVVLTRTPDAFAGDARANELEFSAETPGALCERLRSLGHRRVALLGGSQVHSLFLDAGLVDELWLTLEPRLFGSGTPLLSAKTDLRLKLLGHEHLGGDTLLVKYTVRR
jgi:dihydrofolate reductase